MVIGDLLVRSNRFVLKSTAAGNKKVPKDFLYMSWTDGKMEKAETATEADSLEYGFSGPGDRIYAREQEQARR